MKENQEIINTEKYKNNHTKSQLANITGFWTECLNFEHMNENEIYILAKSNSTW